MVQQDFGDAYMHWPIALICTIVFCVLVLSGALVGASPLAQFMVAVAVFMAGVTASLIRARRAGQTVSPVPWIWGAAGLIVMLAFGYQQRSDILALSMMERNPDVLQDPGTLISEVMLMRAWDGHFRAVAEMNGQPVGLLVDTGASIVLIRYDDAQRIGIKDHELNFSMPVTTASGRSFVAPVHFDSIIIGGIVVRDVKGAVAQPGELHTSLLGMSFIENLHEAVFRSDRLILRQ